MFFFGLDRDQLQVSPGEAESLVAFDLQPTFLQPSLEEVSSPAALFVEILPSPAALSGFLPAVFFHCRELNPKTPLKFVHTSFHGVGHDYVQLAFQAFGFQPPIPVPEQKDPDPDFSTVKCPNPEEGESVLVGFAFTGLWATGIRGRRRRVCLLQGDHLGSTL